MKKTKKEIDKSKTFTCRDSNALLTCRVTTSNAPANNSVLFTISGVGKGKRKHSVMLCQEQLHELIDRCNKILKNDTINYEDAYPFLTEWLSKSEQLACDLMHNYIGNNSSAYIDGYYDALLRHAKNPNANLIELSEYYDEFDEVIYNHADIVCRFMRQLKQVIYRLHTGTEPIIVFIVDQIDNPEICYSSITVTYKPYKNGSEMMKKPWRLTFNEEDRLFGGPSRRNNIVFNEHEINIQLSTQDIRKLISFVAEQTTYVAQ